MSTKLDLVGQTFTRLTVIEEVEKHKGRRAYLCQCSCGNQIITTGQLLRRGKTSCGCLAKENRKPKIFKERSITCPVCNKVFKHRKGFRKTYCSNKCYRKHRTQYHKVWHEQNSTTFQSILLRAIRNGYNRAKKKGLVFELTYEYLWATLISQDFKCAATGILLVDNTKSYKQGLNPNGLSLDRHDNNLGYTKENTRIVCNIYNHCKNIWKEDDVIEFCKAYLKHQKIKEVEK